MDEYPFELPLELCEKIFNYLNSSDLLSCTLVSHGWNNFLGSNFMKNILLKVDDDNASKDIAEKSERIYRRAKCTRLSKANLYSVIKFLSLTIVEMELDEVNYRGDSQFTMKFPHLKELTLSCCSTDALKLFSLKCEKLKSLSLYQLNHGPTENVRKFLNSNGTIEELNFYLNDNFRIFDDSLGDIKLPNLTSIFISHKSNEELQSLTLKNIEAFLIAQGDRLLTLSLLHAANLLLLTRIWNHLKVVKRIYFFSTDPFFDYCDDLLAASDMNKNIYLTELELHSLAPYPFTLEDVKPFLDASTNLSSLAVWQLRKDIAMYANESLKNLKSISYVTVDDDCKSYLKSKNGTNDKLRFNQYLV